MNKLSSGAVLSLTSTGVVRAAALASQIGLGALLAQEDFAVFGVALSLAAFLSALSNGGTQQLLVQRWRDYPSLAPQVSFVAFCFNTLSGLLLVGLAYWWSQQTNIAILLPLCVLMAIGSIAMTPVHILKSRLAIDQRFAALSLVNGAPGVFRHLLAILFASIGLGAISFALPAVCEALIAFVLIYFLVKKIPIPSRPTAFEFRGIISAARWQMVGTFGLSMSLYGQFFFVGLILSKYDLGVFVFSMQLVQAGSVLLTAIVTDVLFPKIAVFYKESDNADRVLLNTLKTGFLFALATSAAVITLAGPLIGMLWGDKWLDAIAPSQILAIFISANVARAILSAVLITRAQWATQAVLQLIFVALDILIIVVMQDSATVAEICFGLSIVRALSTIVTSLYVFRHTMMLAAQKLFEPVVYFFPLFMYVAAPISGIGSKPFLGSNMTLLVGAFCLYLCFRAYMSMKSLVPLIVVSSNVGDD